MRLAVRHIVSTFAALSLAQSAPAQAGPPSREQRLADLELVRTEYLPKEQAFSPVARRLAERRIDELEARAGDLGDADLLVGLARIGALADNAHSGIRYHDPQARPKLRLPLRLIWFPDGLFVARAQGEAAELAGAQVVSIEGRTPEALYQRVKVLAGGPPVHRKKVLPEFIESGGVLYALGLARAPDRLALDLRLPRGRTIKRSISFSSVAGQGPTAEFERLWSGEPLPKEAGWRSAVDPNRLPLYLRDANRPFRLVDVPQLDAMYIQFRSNEDVEGYQIAAFLAEVQPRLRASAVENLIVDLRFDIGGDLTTTLDFMRRLPAAASKRVFLLIGPYTWSAGIISAAAVKQAGRDKVVIVGDQVGDRQQFWSEGDLVKLPNSGLAMRYTDGQWDLAAGCDTKPKCVGDLARVDFVSLKPDVFAPLTARAYLAARDPAMDVVRTQISN